VFAEAVNGRGDRENVGWNKGGSFPVKRLNEDMQKIWFEELNLSDLYI